MTPRKGLKRKSGRKRVGWWKEEGKSFQKRHRIGTVDATLDGIDIVLQLFNEPNERWTVDLLRLESRIRCFLSSNRGSTEPLLNLAISPVT